MDKSHIFNAVNIFFDDVYMHTLRAMKKEENDNKYTTSPFSIFMGKMLEHIYFYDAGIARCSQPDLSLDGYDGGVDLTIDDRPVSVKLRSLKHNKIDYLNKDSFMFGKQYDQAHKIIQQLMTENKKCDYIVGAIKYETSLFQEWMNIYNYAPHTMRQILCNLTVDIFTNECMWFTTKGGNIEIS